MSIATTIKQIILERLPTAIVIVDDPNNDGEHFEAIVICDTFETMSLLHQHRVIMTPLKEAFADRVHALALKTFSTSKWNKQKNNYPIIDQRIKELKNEHSY